MSAKQCSRKRIFLATGTLFSASCLAATLWHSPGDGAGVVAAEQAPPANTAGEEPLLEFTDDGALIRPTGYRKWMYVGTPVTPNDMNDGEAPFPEFHNVYIDHVSFAEYERTGEFPDGTIFVKELVSVGEKEATSGIGYFMGEFNGLEVAIKDSDRFADEPGYWAYFSFGHVPPLAEQAEKLSVFSCNACHDGSADQDWVFTQYYPVLRAAAEAAGNAQ